MKLRTNVKAGARRQNANETVVSAPKAGLKLKTRIQAGARRQNANETVVAARGRKTRAKKRA